MKRLATLGGGIMAVLGKRLARNVEDSQLRQVSNPRDQCPGRKMGAWHDACPCCMTNHCEAVTPAPPSRGWQGDSLSRTPTLSSPGRAAQPLRCRRRDTPNCRSKSVELQFEGSMERQPYSFDRLQGTRCIRDGAGGVGFSNRTALWVCCQRAMGSRMLACAWMLYRSIRP
jgi:hypothetical protein